MLQTEPERRPSINQILKVPFIKERVATLLNEDDFKEEFSHTILHNQNVFDQFKALQIDKKKKEEQQKAEEEEKKKQEQLEQDMDGLKINLNFQPKNGQDPMVFN